MEKKIFDCPVKTTIISTETEARTYADGATKSQSLSSKDTTSKPSVSEDSLTGESARLRKQKETMALMREYSVPYDFSSTTPPFPEMVLNTCFYNLIIDKAVCRYRDGQKVR